MSAETVINAAVEKVAQVSDPMAIASELAGVVRPLLESHSKSELDTRHKVGTHLNSRLKPAGQKRLPYGGKVMKHLSEILNISRSVLDRMCQFARQYQTLADFEAAHPDVKTWDGVKKALVKPRPATQRPKDQTVVFWKQSARTLSNLLERVVKAPEGSDATLVKECFEKSQALAEKLHVHFLTYSTATQEQSYSGPFEVSACVRQ